MFAKTPSHVEPNAQAPEHEKTLGSFLQSARISQGLTLATIAQETRINENSLIALEKNNRSALPADVFSRGFVRLYATYLKLDSGEAIRLYERQWGGNGKFSDHHPPQSSSPSLALPGFIISLLLIAIFFGVRIYYPSQFDDAGPRPVKDNSGLSPTPQSPPAIDTNQATTPTTATPQEIKTTAAAPAAIEQAETAAPEASTPSPATMPPPYEIRLQSLKKTRIKLALDGQGLIEKNLRPGSSQAWQAAKSFDLTVDSTAGINLTVNGTTIPIPADAGQTVTIHRP